MAVTTVIERWQGRGATTDDQGVRTLKRQWVVTTDSDTTGEPAVIDGVIAHDASAELYAAHPNWAWAVCRKLNAEPHNGPRLWLVNAEYSTAQFKASGDGSGAGGNTTSPSPLQSNRTNADARPPAVTIARKEVSKVLEKDAVTGDRVLNTAGDPFDPLPEVFRSHHLITIKFFRQLAALNWTARSAFMDTINSSTIVLLGRTYPVLTLRCTEYSLDTVWDKGEAGMTLFFALTVQLEFDPDGWQPKILNTGRRWFDPGSVGDPLRPPRYVAIVDQAGQPVADPVPLSAAGRPLVPGDPYHYVEPAGYVPRSWATLLA